MGRNSMKVENAVGLVESEDYVFIDTRSPSEYAKDHFYGAYNIPLLDDKEREQVGKLYKNVGKEKAIEKGYEVVNPKIESMLSQYGNIGNNKKLIIYCWRGGMRSRAVTELLNSRGFDAVQLEGGYKEYRKFIRNSLGKFQFMPKLIVIKGLTGTGKTDFLRKTSLPGIDLEGLARHRSSVFGALGLRPVSQKMFESSLYFCLRKLNKKDFVLVEGESRKIGNIILPEFLHKKMLQSPMAIFEVSVDGRVKNIMDEYGLISGYDKSRLKRIVQSIRKKISKETYENLNSCIDTNDSSNFVRILLLHYYDPLYRYQINNHSAHSIKINTEGLSITQIENKLTSFAKSLS